MGERIINPQVCERISVYDFEYRLIPQCIDQILAKTHDCHKTVVSLCNKGFYRNLLSDIGLVPDFDWNDFMACLFNVSENERVVVYTFPYPTRIPLAKYGAVVANSKGISYYTLEKSEKCNYSEALFEGAELQAEESWVLGATSPKGHTNFGQVPACSSIREFLELLSSRGILSEYKGFEERENPSVGKRPDENTSRFHTSDDGQIFRINDDGSYTRLGNVNHLPIEKDDKKSESKKVKWLQLILVIIGLYFAKCVIVSGDRDFLALFLLIVVFAILYFISRKKKS